MNEAQNSHVDSELLASLFQTPDVAFVSVHELIKVVVGNAEK